MATERDWLPVPLQPLPADLAAVLALVGLAWISVLVPAVRATPLGIFLGVPLALVLPGYAFVAALFPGESSGADDAGTDAPAGESKPGTVVPAIDGVERAALSVGVSITVVPLVGLGLDVTPWGLRLVPLVVAVGGFTAIFTLVAARRRWALPPDERFRVPYRRWFARARAAVFAPETGTDAVLNVMLALSVLLAVASAGYALSVPHEGEQFTEFYVLSEAGDGELVAANYPTEFERDKSKPVVLGVSNHEHKPVEYTVVVQLQRVDVQEGPGNDSTVEVLERDELERVRTELDHGETWQEPVQIEPTMAGEDLRLVFLLYRGQAPAEPTGADAYRQLHLWIDVSEPNEGDRRLVPGET